MNMLEKINKSGVIKIIGKKLIVWDFSTYLKAFWRVFNIITFPIQILFVIIAIILRDIVGAFVLRLGQLILG
ncbi:hypothetical protein, partial [Mesomycoplasma ovipneumoniae]|uniref:hypothetical protein n=1 Tax=Mesomycoplasma ovipneumoniae TaxID=29562 RepID=UPI003080AD5A